MPKQLSGCHNCSQRRIKCDRARPQCEKCLRKGLKCPGYGIRYRFNHGVASRGRFVGHTVPVRDITSDPTQHEIQSAPVLLWPDGTTTSVRDLDGSMLTVRDDEKAQMSLEAFADPCTSDPMSTQDMNMFLDVSNSLAAVADASFETSLLRLTEPLSAQSEVTVPLLMCKVCGTVHSPRPCQAGIPASLELLCPQTRELFDHFSSMIAPVMVVLDGQFNGYRNLILPLACEDELVKSAVCVVCMYHLAHQRPEMQYRADSGFQSLLHRLRQRTSARSDLVDVSAWTTIIILLTGETITGGSNLPYLFKILQHLAAANLKHGRSSVMQSFLTEQTRMMTLFAEPLLEEGVGAMTLASRPEEYFDFISNAAIFQPALAKEIGIYKFAIHSACDIYLTRAMIGPPHSETVPDLDRLKTLCEQIEPTTPGHHTLVWVYFIAAAESSTLEHREFFTTRLQEVFSRTKFHNIPSALAALQEFWKVQQERRWTEILPEVMPVFII